AETAITCLWDAGVSFGDEVVVLGGGVVGALTAWMATAAGARVRLVERSKRRRDAARALGVTHALSPEEDEPRGDADVVVEATGDPSCLDRAIAHAGREATVCIASFYGARSHAVGLGAAFHRRRLALKATQVSAIPPARTPRWTLARRFDLVRRLLEDPRLDALLDEPVPFDEAAQAYLRLDEAPGDFGQITFDYR
ncbi:MAG: zinc-binding alcohol dehydrogenase, partial [Myxococcota bacterium]|nr:zinc-binding alcohol dehydrogenase [Myxococcota bacterium]